MYSVTSVANKFIKAMLKELRIKNFAIIDDLEVEFAPGLNVITGETGAGKSILIGALSLLMGARASSDDIRTDYENAEVEGEFCITRKPDLMESLKSKDLWDDDHGEFVSIRRIISRSGRNRIYINGHPTNLADLKDLVYGLIEIHGQNEHQRLFNLEQHLELLDRYGDLIAFRSEVGRDFLALDSLQKKLTEYLHNQQLAREKLDLFQFQLQEIEQANLSLPEEDNLEQERLILQNAEKLFNLTWNSYESVYGSDKSVLSELKLVDSQIQHLIRIDPSKAEWGQRLHNAFIQLEELALEWRDYSKKRQHDPDRLDEIEARLSLIRSLKKKYNRNIADLLSYAEKIKMELVSFQSSGDKIAHLQAEIERLKDGLAKKALELFQRRQETARRLGEAIESELAELSMEQAGFLVQLTVKPDDQGFVEQRGQKVALSPNGIDEAEFLICPNPGEGFKSLVKIISGGELSRVSLAIKSILSDIDDIPVMIFDEVDAGIGGKVGEVVGSKLKSIATSRQVLCITHLPQIASRADAHYLIRKDVREGRTRTLVNRLDYEERINEIARMSSGKTITRTALEHAREMLEKSG